MVNKTTKFKKGKGKKNFKKDGKGVAALGKQVSAFWEWGSPDLPA